MPSDTQLTSNEHTEFWIVEARLHSDPRNWFPTSVHESEGDALGRKNVDDREYRRADHRVSKLVRCTHETCERRNQDERTLRRLLAFAYSGSALYGDDGELQDGRHPMIDYVRDSVADIERKIHERGMAKLAAAACPECRYVIGHKAGCSSEKAKLGGSFPEKRDV